MELVVLYSHTKNKLIAKYLLHHHAVKWIKVGENIPDTSVLIVAGGDGTINYAVNNINLQKTKLLILPLGRGNAFSRINNLHLQVLNPDFLNNYSEFEVPLLEVNQQLGVFAAGMGKGGEIMRYANPYSQYGFPTYILSAVKSINTYPSYDLMINNVFYEDLLTAEISLWGRVGFGLPLTKNHTLGPYLTIVRGDPLITAIAFISGQFSDWEGAITFKGDSFILETDNIIDAHIDGESFYTKNLTVKISQEKLTIIKPQVSSLTSS